MNQPPCISICVPTFNGRRHLAECIGGIRAQSFQDFEVVICDDQSSDGTLDFTRELAQGDGRFRFIANPRRFGLAGNWNNCVKQARGEWIKFVFQDDIIAPSCLEKLLNACRRTNKPFGFCERSFVFEEGVTGTLRDWFDGHKRRLRLDYQADAVIDAERSAKIAIHEPSHNMVGEPTVTLINKSIFSEMGGFDEVLIQLCDSEFWCRVMVNHGAAFVAEDLATFRIHAKATTALNHGKRVFRMEVLDSLVLRYRFAFGRHFKPLRNSRYSGKSALSLRRECATAAARAWRQARRDGGFEENSSISEWQAIKPHCPGLQAIACFGELLGWMNCGKKYA